MLDVKPEGEVEVYVTAVGGEAQHRWHWEIVADVKSKHNNIEKNTHTLSPPTTSLLILPPSDPHYSPTLFSSPLLLSPRSLSGSLFPAAHMPLVRDFCGRGGVQERRRRRQEAQ